MLHRLSTFAHHYSVQFSCSVVSDSLRSHESQHARPPCPSPTPRVCSNSCPSSQWCHPAISSTLVPFSSCPQFLPASGSFPMSQLFSWSARNETGSKTWCDPSLLELGQVGSTLYLTVCKHLACSKRNLTASPKPHPPLPSSWEVTSTPLTFFSKSRHVMVSPSEHIWLMFILSSFSG